MSKTHHITVGDIVSVHVHAGQYTISHEAEVLYIPCATGDSWIFKDLYTDDIHYVSEGCTVTKEPNRNNGDDNSDTDYGTTTSDVSDDYFTEEKIEQLVTQHNWEMIEAGNGKYKLRQKENHYMTTVDFSAPDHMVKKYLVKNDTK